jgi:alkaline phosphatase
LPSNTTDPASSAKKGDRVDNRNLINEWEKKMEKAGKKHKYVWNIGDFNSLKANEHDHVLGLLSHDHMDYELDRQPLEQPSIVEMTTKAIDLLKTNPNGFFLLVEGGKIDHGTSSIFLSLKGPIQSTKRFFSFQSSSRFAS